MCVEQACEVGGIVDMTTSSPSSYYSSDNHASRMLSDAHDGLSFQSRAAKNPKLLIGWEIFAEDIGFGFVAGLQRTPQGKVFADVQVCMHCSYTSSSS